METTFVGRDKEVNQILSVWNTILTKSINVPRIVFVEGEAGIGKSTLVNHVIHEIKSKLAINNNGILIGSGHCEVFEEAQIAYLPFYQILDKLKVSIPLQSKLAKLNQFNQIVQEIAPGWFKILPVIGEPIADTLKSASKLRKQADEKRNFLPSKQLDIDIYAQYLKILEGLFENSKYPILIFVDDIQWADQESLHLLAYLGQYLPKTNIPVLLIGCYRSESLKSAPSQDSNLTTMLARLKQRSLSITINLLPFSNEEANEYIDQAYTTEPKHKSLDFPQHLREMLHLQTGGNPLFLNELLAILEERGHIQKTSDGWKAKKTSDFLDNLPNSLQATLEERIGRLEKRLREILTIASVEGENFTVQVVARVNNSEFSDVLDSLVRELTKKYGLVKELAEQEIAFRKFLTLYTFNHGLIRKFVYQSLSNAQKRIFHQQVADCLEDLYRENTDPIILQLARHYLIARDYEKIIKYGVIAAQTEYEKQAISQCVFWCDEVLDASKKLNFEHDQKSVTNAIMLKISALVYLGQNDNAYNVIIENQTVIDSSGNPDLEGRMALFRGEVFSRKGRLTEGLESFKKARSIFRLSQNTLLEATALKEIGHLLAAESKFKDAISFWREGIAKAQFIHNWEIEGLIWSEIAEFSIDMGELKISKEASQKALLIFKNMKSKRGIAITLQNMGFAEYVGGSISKSAALFRDAIDIFREVYDFPNVARCGKHLANCFIDLKEKEKAESILEEAQKINLEMSEVGNSPEVYISLARLEILKDNLIKAREYAEQAISIVEDNDYYSWPRARTIMGIIMQSMGNIHVAEQYFIEAVSKCENSGFMYVSACSYLEYGRFLARFGNINLAESYLALALQNFEHIGAARKIEEVRSIVAKLRPTQ